MEIGLVIPCFNHGRYLSECLGSVLALRIPAGVKLAQFTFVDDGSNDSSLKVWTRFAGAFRSAGIKTELLVHEVNRGVSAAFNTGIAKTDTEWIFPFGADNMLLPHALESVYRSAYVEGRRVADVVPLGWRGFGENADGSPYRRTKTYKRHKRPEEVKQGRHLSSGCSPYMRETWDFYPYNEKLLKGEDGDRWKRLASEGYRFKPTKDICALIRGHKYRLSASSDPAKLREFRLKRRV